MRALAREGGVFVQLGVKGRDGHAVVGIGNGSSAGSAKLET